MVGLRVLGIGCCLMLLSQATASAQTPFGSPPRPQGFGGIGSPSSSPTFSPYLNLYRSGSGFATNYYGLVRPGIEFRNAISGLQQQVSEVQTITGDLQSGAGASLVTGTRPRFLNTSGYFLSLNRGGGAPVGTGGTGTVQNPLSGGQPFANTNLRPNINQGGGGNRGGGRPNP